MFLKGHTWPVIILWNAVGCNKMNQPLIRYIYFYDHFQRMTKTWPTESYYPQLIVTIPWHQVTYPEVLC